MYVSSQLKVGMSKFIENMVILQVPVRHSFPIESYASREKKNWSHFTLVKQSRVLQPVFRRKYFCPQAKHFFISKSLSDKEWKLHSSRLGCVFKAELDLFSCKCSFMQFLYQCVFIYILSFFFFPSSQDYEVIRGAEFQVRGI